MINPTKVIQIIDDKIDKLLPFSKERDILIEVRTEIEYLLSKELDDMDKALSLSKMLKEEEKNYAYGKGILSDLKKEDIDDMNKELGKMKELGGLLRDFLMKDTEEDEDFVCPLCDGTHGNNALCQI